MNQQKSDILLFWGLMVLLNGILAGSRGLATPLHNTQTPSLTVFIALLLAALFGAAGFLWSVQTTSTGLQIYDLLLPITGSLILFGWGLNLTLWNEWLWGLVLNSITVPLLFLPSTPSRSKQTPVAVWGILVLLGALLWFMLIGRPSWLWWQPLLTGIGTISLFAVWFLRQNDPQKGWLTTGIALILFIQLALITLFLPLAASSSLTLIVVLFGTICWLGRSPLHQR